MFAVYKMVQKNNFYYSLHNCEDLKTTNPIRKIKEVLEWLYNTLYQKFIGNFHVILKLCFWWQCYKPLQDNKQIVCLFVSRTLWVLVRRLWQSYSSPLRLPKYQHNKLTICVVLQTNQVLCPQAHCSPHHIAFVETPVLQTVI